MRTIRKKILLITKSDEPYLLIKKQLEDIFSNTVLVEKDAATTDFNGLDLVLSTYEDEVVGIPVEKRLRAKRTIHISFIEKLIQLPRTMTCYVASNTYEASLESINMLSEFGFQLKMIPYPRDEAEISKDVSVVITHDVQLVQTDRFRKVIEIGIRPLDFSTIVEIAVRLQLPIHTHSVYKATNMEEIVRLNHDLSLSILQLKSVYQQVEAIINTSQDGILTINSQGTIIQVNKALLGFLQRTQETDLIGKSFSTVIPTFEYFQNKDHYLYSINGFRFVVQQLPITLSDGEIGTLILFREVNKLQQIEQEVRRKIHAQGFVSRYKFADIIGSSQTLKATLEKAKRLGPFEQPVLILGENGTGKELFAHSLHQVSNRRNHPFVPINFAGLPETLAESELFGYEDGAFTGAKKGGKPGFFELAHNGTIFLDEIGDAPASIQAALLRVLQEKQILRVGGTQLIPINVRIIAATNKDLLKLVEEGKFREDLFYRLNVLPLYLPALKERKEDIPLLMDYFFKKQNMKQVTLGDMVIERFLSYSWPGNIRELENTVYYLAAIIKDEVVRLEDLPHKFLNDNQVYNLSVVEALESEGSVTEFFEILSYLHLAKQQNWLTGRTAMEAYFKKENRVQLSAQQIKSRMAILKKYHLVEIGSTRRGSWITKLGMDTMTSLKEEIRLN